MTIARTSASKAVQKLCGDCSVDGCNGIRHPSLSPQPAGACHHVFISPAADVQFAVQFQAGWACRLRAGGSAAGVAEEPLHGGEEAQLVPQQRPIQHPAWQLRSGPTERPLQGRELPLSCACCGGDGGGGRLTWGSSSRCAVPRVQYLKWRGEIQGQGRVDEGAVAAQCLA